MQIDMIQLFCDVAQHRSVSRAAEAHGVTQSAVSQRIMALERDLGVQLIDRSKRPLQLTEAGQTYYQGCRQILDDYALLTERIASPRAVDRGTIRVAAIYSAGIDLLNKAVEAFEARHPRVSVEVRYQQPDEVNQCVIDEKVDFGIISFPQQWRGLTALPLRDEEMAIVAQASHPIAGRRQMHASDLADYSLVMFDSELPIGRRINAYLREQGVTPHIAHTFDNIDTIKVYLQHSDELAILPLRTVQREVAEGTLTAVSLRPLLIRPLAVVHHRQRRLNPLTKTFIDFLLATSSAPSAAKSTAAPATTA